MLYLRASCRTYMPQIMALWRSLTSAYERIPTTPTSLCARTAPKIRDCVISSLKQSSGLSRSSSNVEANASG